jgi:hypothetical protein
VLKFNHYFDLLWQFGQFAENKLIVLLGEKMSVRRKKPLFSQVETDFQGDWIEIFPTTLDRGVGFHEDDDSIAFVKL